MDRAATYATTVTVAMARPWLMCEAATCPHASAASASHPIRLDHRLAPRYPDAPTSTNGVHASVPAKGSEMATTEVAMIMAYDSAPAAAAARCSRSRLRNQYSPRPASSGLSTMKRRMAVPHLRIENSAMPAAFSHPDCGSAAYGMPAIWKGFHSGIWPEDRLCPRKQ